ncbi:21877_t:CDS:2, partial [Dentiscutata erythropus]
YENMDKKVSTNGKMWASLKTKISEKNKAKNEQEIMILWLKRLKQKEKKSVKEYTNRYEAHTESVELLNDDEYYNIRSVAKQKRSNETLELLEQS